MIRLIWANCKVSCFILAVVIIISIGLHFSVLGQEFIKIRRSTVFTAAAGNKLGEMGIEYSDNPSVVGDSINPIYICQNGKILVGDSLNQRLQEFDMSGKPLREYLLSKTAGNIMSITVFGNNIYALTGPRPVEVTIFGLDGKLINTINLANVGELERRSEGTIALKKERLNGTNNKILCSRDGDIFVLNSDLIMINDAGKVMRRWGPYVNDFIIDRDGNLLIKYGGEKIEIYDSHYKLLKKFEQDIRGQFVGKEWGSMIWPQYVDANSNFYGFIAGKDEYLGRYLVKDKRISLFPIKRSDFIGVSWTIDSKGNIYYAETTFKFTLTKVAGIEQ